jgi:hypothetical protein
MMLSLVGVPPSPIFFLLVRRKLAEVSVGVSMGFRCPTVIVDILVVIPDVIVGVIGIIDAVMMLGASRQQRQRHSQHTYLAQSTAF